MTTDKNLVSEYWTAVSSGDPRARELAVRLLESDECPSTDAFHSALCILFHYDEVALAKRTIENALIRDFDACSPDLLPLLAHAYQRTHDIESAHLIFEKCAQFGLLAGKNAFLLPTAVQATHILAGHVTHKSFAAEVTHSGPDVFEASRVMSRILSEDYFAGVRTLAGREQRRGTRTSPAATRMPDFIVAGSAKCGTTYLYDLICRSPSVWDGTPKEIHYFTSMYQFGSSFYSRFFELCPEGLQCGEASPDYLDEWSAEKPTAERIQRDCPAARVVVVLRDPALRAVSWYNHMTTNDVSRGPRPGNRRLSDLTMDDLQNYWDGRALRTGLFVDRLRKFAEVLGRDRILIVTFPELVDVTALAQRLSTFLDIEPPPANQTDVLKRNGGAHDRPSEQLYSALRDYYRESLVQLESEFGIRL